MCNSVTVAAYLIFVVCLLVVISGGTIKGRAVVCAPNSPLKSRHMDLMPPVSFSFQYTNMVAPSCQPYSALKACLLIGYFTISTAA